MNDRETRGASESPLAIGGNRRRSPIHALTRCGHGVARPVAPKASCIAALVCAALLVSTALANTAAAQVVTGGTRFLEDGFSYVLSFSAVQHADGSVRGQGVYLVKEGSAIVFRSHLQITCMNSADGATVILSGVVTQDTDPTFVGDSFAFAVRDNGNGSTAPPDQATGVAYGIDWGVDWTCADQEFVEAQGIDLDEALDPIQGNVHVKP